MERAYLTPPDYDGKQMQQRFADKHRKALVIGNQEYVPDVQGPARLQYAHRDAQEIHAKLQKQGFTSRHRGLCEMRCDLDATQMRQAIDRFIDTDVEEGNVVCAHAAQTSAGALQHWLMPPVLLVTRAVCHAGLIGVQDVHV